MSRRRKGRSQRKLEQQKQVAAIAKKRAVPEIRASADEPSLSPSAPISRSSSPGSEDEPPTRPDDAPSMPSSDPERRSSSPSGRDKTSSRSTDSRYRRYKPQSYRTEEEALRFKTERNADAALRAERDVLSDEAFGYRAANDENSQALRKQRLPFIAAYTERLKTLYETNASREYLTFRFYQKQLSAIFKLSFSASPRDIEELLIPDLDTIIKELKGTDATSALSEDSLTVLMNDATFIRKTLTDAVDSATSIRGKVKTVAQKLFTDWKTSQLKALEETGGLVGILAKVLSPKQNERLDPQEIVRQQYERAQAKIDRTIILRTDTPRGTDVSLPPDDRDTDMDEGGLSPERRVSTEPKRDTGTPRRVRELNTIPPVLRPAAPPPPTSDTPVTRLLKDEIKHLKEIGKRLKELTKVIETEQEESDIDKIKDAFNKGTDASSKTDSDDGTSASDVLGAAKVLRTGSNAAKAKTIFDVSSRLLLGPLGARLLAFLASPILLKTMAVLGTTAVVGGFIASRLSDAAKERKDAIDLENMPMAPQKTLTFASKSNQPVPESVEQHTASDSIIARIARTEGFREKAYEDGKEADGSIDYAIGHGLHTWKGKEVTNTYPGTVTVAESLEEMKSQISSVYAPIVKKELTKAVTPEQFDSLVSVAYNRGTAKDLATKMNAGETPSYMDYVSSATSKDKGYLPSLELRRAEEFGVATNNEALLDLIDGLKQLNIPATEKVTRVRRFLTNQAETNPTALVEPPPAPPTEQPTGTPQNTATEAPQAASTTTTTATKVTPSPSQQKPSTKIQSSVPLTDREPVGVIFTPRYPHRFDSPTRLNDVQIFPSTPPSATPVAPVPDAAPTGNTSSGASVSPMARMFLPQTPNRDALVSYGSPATVDNEDPMQNYRRVMTTEMVKAYTDSGRKQQNQIVSLIRNQFNSTVVSGGGGASRPPLLSPENSEPTFRKLLA